MAMSTTVPAMSSCTTYSTFWRPVAPAGQGAVYTELSGRNSTLRRVGVILGRPGFRAMRRQMRVLLGAAVGGTATEQHYRIQAAPDALYSFSQTGGVRTVEQVTDINAATTANDLTFFQKMLDTAFVSNPTLVSGYPDDLSGNGYAAAVQLAQAGTATWPTKKLLLLLR
jgi:hypothetical protein